MSEKNLNFDQPVERRGTHSLKYDFAEERGPALTLRTMNLSECGSLIWILRRHLSFRKH